MKYETMKPMMMYIDNQSAIKISLNDVEHDRTKHIDIRYYAIREQIKQGEIAVEYVNTHEQAADIFTKSLAQPAFTHIRNKLMKMRNTQQTHMQLCVSVHYNDSDREYKNTNVKHDTDNNDTDCQDRHKHKT